MATLARVLAENSIPPLDAGLKSIFVQQVRNLLKGGWPRVEIERNAIQLAMRYDRFHGHKAMTQLQALMEKADESSQEQRHKAVMDSANTAAEQAAMNLAAQGVKVPGIDRMMSHYASVERARQHPNAHDFTADPADRMSCSVCGGPTGVHVRRMVIA